MESINIGKLEVALDSRKILVAHSMVCSCNHSYSAMYVLDSRKLTPGWLNLLSTEQRITALLPSSIKTVPVGTGGWKSISGRAKTGINSF